jgi:hypothetical protein
MLPLFMLPSEHLFAFVEIFPFFCEFAVAYFSSVCVKGVAVIIGLGCVTSAHVAFRLSFCFWLRLFLSGESVVAYFSRLLCRKSLATVISVRTYESATPRR